MMPYIDIHARMSTRTAEDYERLALAGYGIIAEPAGWPGWTRRTIAAFENHFRQLTEFEPERAAGHGIRYLAWLGASPYEAEDRELVLAILSRLPRHLERPNVLGVGGMGLFRGTTNELKTLKDHVDLAVDLGLPALVRTPPLGAKLRGTRLILDALTGDERVDPARVLIDHAEEHTLEAILGRGFWAGLTLDSPTGLSPERAADLIERFGTERICVDSGCDRDVGSPLAVARLAAELRRRGHEESLIRAVVLDNPAAFLADSPAFQDAVRALPANRAPLTPDGAATARAPDAPETTEAPDAPATPSVPGALDADRSRTYEPSPDSPIAAGGQAD
jgi:predicted metal-dependent TIM-barrel fold hydrolase